MKRRISEPPKPDRQGKRGADRDRRLSAEKAAKKIRPEDQKRPGSDKDPDKIAGVSKEAKRRDTEEGVSRRPRGKYINFIPK